MPVTRSTSVPPYTRGAIRFCTSLENALERRLVSGSPPLCLAAVNHDRAGPEVFHPINAELANLGTVKSRRNKRANGWDLVVILYCGCACVVRACEEAPTPGLNGFAAVANWLKASRETPVSATNRPIKTRRLKNADWEVDFFFIKRCQVELI